ncbi:MAG: gamma-glutamylcyclotransferase [Bradymonadia bacterium]
MPWLFGYGSIIWRPNIKFQRKAPATLPGWRRSFCQLSVDHRGTPEAPGRVLTLREDAQARCDGVAFEVSSSLWHETLAYYDEREKGGYRRLDVMLECGDTRIPAVTYVAPPGNPHDAGAEPLEHIVSVIRTAEGPSGTNLEYFLNLVDILRANGIKDSYLSQVLAVFRSLD